MHTYFYLCITVRYPQPTYRWKAEIAPVTALVLVYYSPTLSICDKWAESDSFFLKSGTHLVTNWSCKNQIHVPIPTFIRQDEFRRRLFLLPPFFNFLSHSLTFSQGF
jgi:hypothetical protein